MEQLVPVSNPHHPNTPNFWVRSLADIDIRRLHRLGIRCLAVDLDSTLVWNGALDISEDTLSLIAQWRSSGLIGRLAIATNRRLRWAAPLAARIQADAVMQAHGLVRKPRRVYFQELLRRLGCPARQTAIIGDRLLQDVLGGNRAGLTTILVEPLGPPAWGDRLLLHRWRQQRRLRRMRRSLPDWLS